MDETLFFIKTQLEKEDNFNIYEYENKLIRCSNEYLLCYFVVIHSLKNRLFHNLNLIVVPCGTCRVP